MPQIRTYDDLKQFLESKSGLRMAHIYKPAMLLAVIRNGGRATKEQIAREFLRRDTSPRAGNTLRRVGEGRSAR